MVIDVLRKGPISREDVLAKVAPLIPVEYAWKCYLVDNKHGPDYEATAARKQHAQAHVVTKVLRELRSKGRLIEANGLIEMV